MSSIKEKKRRKDGDEEIEETGGEIEGEPQGGRRGKRGGIKEKEDKHKSEKIGIHIQNNDATKK